MPSILDNYTLRESMEAVAGTTLYRAQGPSDKDRVVLVVLDARRGASQRAQIEEVRTRAEAVMRRFAPVWTSPQIAQLVGPLEGALGVAYVDQGGIPLSVWRARYGAVTSYDAIGCAVAILRVLRTAHAHGVVHRALSPSMVWVEDAPRLRLVSVLGFGLAELVQREQRWAQTATLQSDVRFMAPEQFTGEPIDVRSDLYSVGLLLHAMLSDVPAVSGASVYAQVQAHCDGALAEISPPERASDGLRQIVRRALARAPKARFQHAAEMLDALHEEQTRSTRSLPSVGTTQVYSNDAQGADTQPTASLSQQEAQERESLTPQPRQTTPPRVNPSRYARSVDTSQLSKAELAAGNKGFPWRIVVVAWLLAMLFGGVALWRMQQDVPADEVPADAVSDTEGPLDCRWEHVARALPVGETELRLNGTQTIVLSYDRMNVRVMRMEEDDPQTLRFVRAFGSVELWHRRLEEDGRDWLFLLPRVRHAQKPSVWALQFEGDRLLTSQRLPLGLETIERARLQMRLRDGVCMLWVRVEGDRGPGPEDKEIWLRMTDPGVVVAEGALGGLWAPALDESPL